MTFSTTSLRILIVQFYLDQNCPSRFGKKNVVRGQTRLYVMVYALKTISDDFNNHRRNWIIKSSRVTWRCADCCNTRSKAKLTTELAESERRRVGKRESISETVRQIKEQVMTLARQPITLAPDYNDDESNENDYVWRTPYFRSFNIYELFQILKRTLKDIISI